MSVSSEVKGKDTPNVRVATRRDRSRLAARVAALALVGSHLNYLLMSVLFPGTAERYESVNVSPEFIIGGIFLIGACLLYVLEGCPRVARRRIDISLAALGLASVFMFVSMIHNAIPFRYAITIVTCIAYFMAGRFLAAFYMPRFASAFKNVWVFITPAFFGLLVYLYLSGRFLFIMSETTGLPQPYIAGGIRPTEIALYVSLQIIYLTYCLNINRGRARRGLILVFLAASVLLLLWLQSVSAFVGMAMVMGAYLLFVGRHRRLAASLLLVGMLAAGGMLLFNLSKVEPLLSKMQDMASVKKDEFTGGQGKRAVMFSILAQLARAHPLYGIGRGRFAADGYIMETIGSLGPHNDVLGIAAEDGIPAATFYVFYVVSVLVMGIAPFINKKRRRILSQDRTMQQFQFMALACFGFCQWRGLVHDTGGFKEVYFWAGMIAGTSLWRVNRRPQRKSKSMAKLSLCKKAVVPRRIAVVAPFGTLDHQPCILSAVTCFADAGYEVDVFALRNLNYAPSHFAYDTVRMRYLPISFRARKESRLWATILFMLWMPFALRGRYAAVYAAGIRALLAAWCASWFRHDRIINHQLELYIGAKLNVRFPRVFKWLERRAIRSCFLSIDHDETRARMLCEDAGIRRDVVEVVPNAPCGTAHVQRSRFLAERLGIGPETRLLISAGNISPMFMSEETVVAAQALPDGWICVLHSAQPRAEDDVYIILLKSANTQGKVFFSLDPVPYERVPQILSSADIGLALYGAVGGPNTTEVGLASGKLCHFLQHGVPVIVSDLPALREFVEKHRVGVPLADLADLPKAITTIMNDYEGYCRRAAETFTRELAFQTHFQRVLDRLAQVQE